MYCIKCGVRLSEGQTLCPICGTRVYHPDFEITESNTYPKGEFKSEEFNRVGLLFVITLLCLIPLILPMILDMAWHGEISWSGYVTGGMVLFYVGFILPLWFKKPNPVIFTPCFFAATTLYLLYISWQSEGGWFLTFALPLILSLTAIITAIVTLLHYLKRGRLYVFGGGLIALGVWTVLLELLIKAVFDTATKFMWSVAPLALFTLFGIALIVIGIVTPLKESLRKLFYIGKIE